MNHPVSAKYGYIDAVRGIAILLVILLHVSYAVKGLPEIFYYMSTKGSFGVQLFFVASAFTLFSSYSGRLKKEGEHTDRNFFIRRFFRISPMYYLAVIVYCIIFYYIPAYNNGKPLAIWKVMLNVFYFNGFVPAAINYVPPGGWSVGVEMLFYCCLPFLFRKIKTLKAAISWFLLLAILTVALKLIIRKMLITLSIDFVDPEGWFLYYWFPNQVAVFMLGIVLFFCLRKYRVTNKRHVYIALAVSLVLLTGFAYIRRDIDPYNIIPEHIIVAMFFAVNMFLMAQHKVAVFDNRFTRYLGQISFSLYLVHFIVVYVLEDWVHLPVAPFVQYLVILTATVLISSIISRVTYKVVELNGIRFGNGYTVHTLKSGISEKELVKNDPAL